VAKKDNFCPEFERWLIFVDIILILLPYKL